MALVAALTVRYNGHIETVARPPIRNRKNKKKQAHTCRGGGTRRAEVCTVVNFVFRGDAHL